LSADSGSIFQDYHGSGQIAKKFSKKRRKRGDESVEEVDGSG